MAGLIASFGATLLQSGPLPLGTPELAVFLAIGVLGGAHCLGMCGPLVGLYADRLGEDGLTPRALRQHALFNLGRTAGYATAGFLLGGLGALVFDAAAFAAVATPVRGVAGVSAGVFILLTGASYAVGGRTRELPGLSGLFSRVSGGLTARVDRWVGGPRIVGLGAVHALLPCPILYPVYLYALARGSPLDGAVALALVGLGTFPTLFASGLAVGSVGPDNRARLHRVLGAAFILLGYIPLAHGMHLLGIGVLPHPTIPVYQPLG